MSTIQQLDFKHFTWTNITNIGENELRFIRQNFNFHPLDLQDVSSENQRNKIDTYKNYIFAAFLFPIYNKTKQQMTTAETDFFVGKDFFVTVQREKFGVINEMFNMLRINEVAQNNYNSHTSSEYLFYDIMFKLYDKIFPMLDHVSEASKEIEEAIFSGRKVGQNNVRRILTIRSNLTDMRKSMQGHKNVLIKALETFRENSNFMMNSSDHYFENLIDTTKELWSILESSKEYIETLHETNTSLISFKLNQIMKTLTIISVITFPITLMAAIFGMNTIKSMPFIENEYGFWVVIAMMVSVATLMLVIFKKKGWF
ncbi:MAG: hypothetical protein COT81_01035 [Candidatus Buchananbacteria bacterium CG10_big_fil_rev_8_21_14_0_10_42_9]|uniref:Magnesium transport protein CorA n=1 Tax=Candidatus Buchananbacteria bacterium CG10_big_fil_rev_8_21_14_0_10_42_9 TaxID=1974526 RepID=A0A2H0W266_9BACT|nr:MAG: hypothetical protein COT81_01035 [Candidatus Buchananbacteria bacterium CG10_big_fil_rev_8_21_14_0_10_42_9]